MKIPRSRYKLMPWKNGLGVTAEIDRFPLGEGAYAWRLSQADITGDGPFSSFPGYDRWLCVWQGAAIRLGDLEVPPLKPVRFSGDDETFCRLTGGPVRDVGLIFDRGRVNAEMKIVEGVLRLPAGVHYLFDLESGDTRKCEHATELSVARSLLVSVTALGLP